MHVELVKHTKAPALQLTLVEEVIKAVRKHTPLPQTYELSVIAVDDAEMKQLNTQYRQESKVTDILSFTYTETSGELVICYPQVQRQADHKVQPFHNELRWLLVHGMLHLQGYDHETAADATIMRPLERTILQSMATAK